MDFIKGLEELVIDQCPFATDKIKAVRDQLDNPLLSREVDTHVEYYLERIRISIGSAVYQRRNIFLSEYLNTALEIRLANAPECERPRRALMNFGFSSMEAGDVLKQLLLVFRIDPVCRDLPTVITLVMAGKRRTDFNSLMWFVGMIAGGLAVKHDQLAEVY